MSLAVAGLVSLGATFDRTLAFDYWFLVETSGNHPMWRKGGGLVPRPRALTSWLESVIRPAREARHDRAIGRGTGLILADAKGLWTEAMTCPLHAFRKGEGVMRVCPAAVIAALRACLR